MTGLGPAAVAVSDHLVHVGIDAAVAARRTVAAIAPGYLDQLDAAGDEAVAAAALAAGRAPVYVEVPEWLRLLVVEAFLGYAAGLAETCVCAPRIDRPAPVYASAWRPGVVSCAGHAGYLFAVRGEASRRCDRCGMVADEVYTDTVLAGPLTFQLGQCPGCHDELRAAAGRSGDDRTEAPR